MTPSVVTHTHGSWQEQRYVKCLTSLDDMRKETVLQEQVDTQRIADAEAALAARRTEAAALGAEFRTTRRKTALNTVSLRSTQAIMPAEYKVMEAALVEREDAVREDRLVFIKLRNEMARMERARREHDHIGDGLHFVDFEQLKIENQVGACGWESHVGASPGTMSHFHR